MLSCCRILLRARKPGQVEYRYVDTPTKCGLEHPSFIVSSVTDGLSSQNSLVPFCAVDEVKADLSTVHWLVRMAEMNRSNATAISEAGVFRSRRRLPFVIALCTWYFFLSERWVGINITSSSTKRNNNEIDIPPQQVSAAGLGGDEIYSWKGNSNMTPIKIFGIGFKKTGTTSLDCMYSHLIDVLGGSRPNEKERASATSDMIKGNETSTLILAEKHHYFQDSPWCHEPNKLYRRFARLYPTSKFVLTTRNTDDWYSSVLRWVKCVPGQKGKCGKRKMERYRAIFGANSTSREDFISAFESHNRYVRQFFNEELNQPHRLLEIDLTNKDYGNGVGWKIFCNFVGLSDEHCPSGDIPHKNKTPSPMI